MKNSLRMTSKILIFMFIALIFLSTVCKVAAAGFDASSVITNLEGHTTGGTEATNEISKKVGKVLAIIRNVAAIIAVVVISILGVKYIVGSVEQKAEYKKNFIPLIVGVLIVVLATQIAKMLFTAAI